MAAGGHARPTVVLDNGAYEIKYGWATDAAAPDRPRHALNCLSRGKNDKRVFVADELATCRDFSGVVFQRPFQRGYLTNWDVETTIWDHVLGRTRLGCNPEEAALVMTEPVCNLPAISDACDQMAFEDYGFAAYCRATAPFLVGQLTLDKDALSCAVIVDAGFSFLTAVVVLDGFPVHGTAKRCQVGGKLLTNHLKEIVSYRQWNMMDETYIMNHVKEQCCFVSSDPLRDLAAVQNGSTEFAREYVLPDQVEHKIGYVRIPGTAERQPNEQILVMNHERFMVPELLFHPSDVGIDQGGLHETVWASIQSAPQAARSRPTALQRTLLQNVLLVGGQAALPGIASRLTSELVKLAPAGAEVHVRVPDRPADAAWRGGAVLASRPEFLTQFAVTKREYEEAGASVCRRRFQF